MVTKDKIESIVNQWIMSSECFLVDIKLAPGRIAVLIDKPDGVTIVECSSLNRYLTEKLDEEQVWETHELEVGSPGIDQPLKVYQQYMRRIGKDIRVITIDGREHKGKLEAADENGIDFLEVLSRKENNKKVLTEMKHHLEYSKIKETKLILSFKN